MGRSELLTPSHICELLPDPFNRRAPSTLLIPARCVRLFDQVMTRYTMNDLIIQLTSCGVPTELRSGAMRVRYQDSGLGLIRRDFRVDKGVWFRLGQMARALGVSRCLLFVALLQAWARRATEFRQIWTDRVWRLVETFRVSRRERDASLTELLGSSPDG